MIEIRIDSRRLARWLAMVIVGLVVVQIAELVARATGRDYLMGFVPLFDLMEQRNVPTLFTATLWLAASAMCVRIAIAARRPSTSMGWLWALVGIVTVFLAIDEMFEVHERLGIFFGGGLAEMIGLDFQPGWTQTGISAWLVLYALGLAIIAPIMILFASKLPGPTRTGSLIAAIVFISGAMGAEMIANLMDWAGHGSTGSAYRILGSTEEVLEMSGIAILLVTLVDYMKRRQITVLLGVPAGVQADPGN